MILPANPSESFRRLNPHLYPTGGAAPCAEPQRDPFDGPEDKDEGEAYYKGRCRICVTSFRRRLLDSDNPMPKFFVDSLVTAGIIAGDDEAHATVKVIQVKVSYSWQERTEITIEAL